MIRLLVKYGADFSTINSYNFNNIVEDLGEDNISHYLVEIIDSLICNMDIRKISFLLYGKIYAEDLEVTIKWINEITDILVELGVNSRSIAYIMYIMKEKIDY